MDELTPDNLPDQSQEPVAAPAQPEPVSEDVKPPLSESVPKEDTPETEPKVPQGHVPYSRLKEEIKKRKELEEQVKSLQESSAPEEEVETEATPEYDVLQKEVRELKLDKLFNQYPELNDKREELDEYLEENSDLSLERAVNLFRVEHGLITAQPERKGLEKVVAGPKTAPIPRWTLEQIDELRNTDEKRWQKLMSEGVFDETLKSW